MFMIEMPLDAAKLLRFAHRQGHPLAPDEDFGYTVHAWLAAALGELAPRPFRLFERPDGLRLLGYSGHPPDLLQDRAETFAEPLAMEVCHWSKVAGKTMPQNWTEGRRLGFEIRACPVVRSDRERDVFLSALDRALENGSTPPSRVEVYLAWIVQRLRAATSPGGEFIDTRGKSHPPAVELLPGRISLTGFRRVRVLRQGRGRNRRAGKGIERPDALFSGDFVIRQSEMFIGLLQRGIGRHRAFGFGMLLLRPPSRQTG